MNKVITPFDYQLKHIDDVIRKLGKHRKVLAQLPTGGGKTVEFSLIVDRYLQKFPRKTVLILVHRIELLTQAKNTIELMFSNLSVDYIVAGVKHVSRCNIYIGMVESVNTRSQFMNLLDIGLVIIDEAHIGNFIKMHEVFTEEMIIGFTATPIAQSKKTPMKNYFNTISVGPQIKELVELGRLSQNITRCPKDVVEENMLQVSSMTGDFDIRQMAKEYQRPKYVNNTFISYLKYCRWEKTLIFNVNVEHSLDVVERFKLSGFNARHVDGETPADKRQEILKWFSETPDAILCNVGIVNVGFDEPSIKNIIVNCSTLSLPKWLQMCGRGGRVTPDKNVFKIIDLGGNSVRFGDWSDDRDWERLFWEPERPGKPGLAPVKVCPECLGLVHAAIRRCPLPSMTGDGLCDYFFEPEEFEETTVFEEMTLMTKSIDIKDLIEKNSRFRPYFTFYELGRICAGKIANKELTLEQVEFMFNQYFEKVKEWYRIQFPKKKFKEEWHREESRKHFYENVRMQKALAEYRDSDGNT